ncbi:Blue copper protein [Quillaja saponaria]|uniref:Blue copper protein n=1 Tax=Quillaja saponaria TaxID=32244 RepID=A0AAD7VGM1_QUISA|nr:Blue copper protein [Quillaja saponaria]
MGHMNTIFLVLVSVFITKEALAAQHVVGGSQGWDASTDFNSWVSGQTFKVGDQLAFKYTSGLHSVVELGSESAYKNCNIGSAVNSMNTGSDVVKLNKPGTRYFACGTLGHCGQGMKVKITTVSAGNAPASTSSSSSSTTTSSAASASLTFVFPLVLTYCIFSHFSFF